MPTRGSGLPRTFIFQRDRALLNGEIDNTWPRTRLGEGCSERNEGIQIACSEKQIKHVEDSVLHRVRTDVNGVLGEQDDGCVKDAALQSPRGVLPHCSPRQILPCPLIWRLPCAVFASARPWQEQQHTYPPLWKVSEYLY